VEVKKYGDNFRKDVIFCPNLYNSDFNTLNWFQITVRILSDWESSGKNENSNYLSEILKNRQSEKLVE
jgi:hypothetical protein